MRLPLTTNAPLLEEIRQAFSTMLPWAIKAKTLEERCDVLSMRVSFHNAEFGHVNSSFGLMLRIYKRTRFSLRLMWTGSHVNVQIIMQGKLRPNARKVVQTLHDCDA